MKRTGRILKNDIIRLKDNVAELVGFQNGPRPHNIDDVGEFYSWQSHSDVLIIGGGVVGSSIAFFLEESFPGAMNITVLEKDPTVNY
jgi:FAD dependent oxidoreductase